MDETKDTATGLELELRKHLDEELTRRWSVFSETVQKTYEFERTSIKFVCWLLGLVITAISVGLLLFGIRTTSEMSSRIDVLLQERLRSDPIMKVYMDELGRTRRQLVLSKWEYQTQLVQRQRGVGWREKVVPRPTNAEIAALTEAIRDRASAAPAMRVALLLYDSGLYAPHLGAGAYYDVDAAKTEAELLDAARATVQHTTDSATKNIGRKILMNSRNGSDRTSVLQAVRDALAGRSKEREFRDEADIYVVRAAVMAWTRSEQLDATELVSLATISNDAHYQTAGRLGALILERKRTQSLEPLRVLGLARDSESRQVLLTVLERCSRYLYALSTHNASALDHNELVMLMDAWYADYTQGLPTVSRHLWVRLSRYDQSLYNDFAAAALRHAATDERKFYAFAGALVADPTVARELPRVPVLRGVHKNGFLVECDMRFKNECKSADGHVIAPTDIQDWTLNFIPNNHYEASLWNPL